MQLRRLIGKHFWSSWGSTSNSRRVHCRAETSRRLTAKIRRYEDTKIRRRENSVEGCAELAGRRPSAAVRGQDDLENTSALRTKWRLFFQIVLSSTARSAVRPVQSAASLPTHANAAIFPRHSYLAT